MTCITEEILDTISNFCKTEDSYCDYSDYEVTYTNKEKTEWALRGFCEVDGHSWHIKHLESLEDLIKSYKEYSNQDIKFYKYFTIDGGKFLEEEYEDYITRVRLLKGEISECINCEGLGYIFTKKEELKKDSVIIKEYNKGFCTAECDECNGRGYF